MTGPIIIIEDDLDDQEILREVFAELGLSASVRFFDSCLKVLDYLIREVVRPFLIISDINLPRMTGIELKQKIDEIETLREKFIPFVFLTTTGDQQIITKALKLVPQGYFVKPTTIRGIRETIAMIIQYWSASRYPNAPTMQL